MLCHIYVLFMLYDSINQTLMFNKINKPISNFKVKIGLGLVADNLAIYKYLLSKKERNLSADKNRIRKFKT